MTGWGSRANRAWVLWLWAMGVLWALMLAAIGVGLVMGLLRPVVADVVATVIFWLVMVGIGVLLGKWWWGKWQKSGAVRREQP